MCWVCLIISIVGLITGIYMDKWHQELDELLNKNAYKVNFSDYLLSGFGVLLIITAVIMIIASVYLCICTYI